MLRDSTVSVHALLRVRDLDALLWAAPPPEWARLALRRAPWVVVRRATQQLGDWPVGVRGELRMQRCAAWLPDRAVEECVTPQQLAAARGWRARPGLNKNPALRGLDEVEAVLDAHGHAGSWGPVGSVGFELASAMPSTHPESDLDLVLRADRPIDRTDAERLHADLSTLAIQVDLLLETPHGAVALSEYVSNHGGMLLRTARGPRLVRDPWTVKCAPAAAG
jgi:phosphoribosyl-dephospho-CoA transferase